MFSVVILVGLEFLQLSGDELKLEYQGTCTRKAGIFSLFKPSMWGG